MSAGCRDRPIPEPISRRFIKNQWFCENSSHKLRDEEPENEIFHIWYYSISSCAGFNHLSATVNNYKECLEICIDARVTFDFNCLSGQFYDQKVKASSLSLITVSSLKNFQISWKSWYLRRSTLLFSSIRGYPKTCSVISWQLAQWDGTYRSLSSSQFWSDMIISVTTTFQVNFHRKLTTVYWTRRITRNTRKLWSQRLTKAAAIFPRPSAPKVSDYFEIFSFQSSSTNRTRPNLILHSSEIKNDT